MFCWRSSFFAYTDFAGGIRITTLRFGSQECLVTRSGALLAADASRPLATPAARRRRVPGIQGATSAVSDLARSNFRIRRPGISGVGVPRRLGYRRAVLTVTIRWSDAWDPGLWVCVDSGAEVAGSPRWPGHLATGK